MPLDKRPDAILFPPGTFPGRPEARLGDMQRALGPLLGGQVSVSANNGGAQNCLATTVPGNAGRGLLFDTDHPTRAREERYHWFVLNRTGPDDWTLGEPLNSFADRTEAIRAGYLKPDDLDASVTEGPEGISPFHAAQRASVAALTAEHRRSMVERLRHVGAIDEAEAVKRLAEIDAATGKRETKGAE